MPVYNEGANIGRALAEIYEHVAIPKRVLVVYDFEGDDTVPVVRELAPRYPGVELVRNTIGRGVLNAIRAGIASTTAEVVVITMADLSDDVSIVPRMVELIGRDGYDIVCASRYMRGGRHIGGPWLKGLMSRAAGLSLRWLASLPTHDATNAFRAYRRRSCWRPRSKASAASNTRWRSRPRRSRRAGGSPRSRPHGATARRASRGSSSASGCRTISNGTATP